MAALCFRMLAAGPPAVVAGLAALTLCLIPSIAREGRGRAHSSPVVYVALTRHRDPFAWKSVALIAAGLATSKSAVGLKLMTDPVPFLVGITLLAILYPLLRRLNGLLACFAVSMVCLITLLVVTRPFDIFRDGRRSSVLR
jgi:hypothetical protein